MRSYRFVKGCHTTETVINRSRFIATVAGELDGEQAQEFVKRIKSEYPDATHNCYAYVAGERGVEQRFSDDGEPQGTAGQPILEVLRRNGLTNTAVVITRYFGGVKLGANGLVTAYAGTTASALSAAPIGIKTYSAIAQIVCSYSDYAPINSLLREFDCKLLASVFDTGATLTVAIPEQAIEDVTAKIADCSKGQARLETEKYEFIDYTV